MFKRILAALVVACLFASPVVAQHNVGPATAPAAWLNPPLNTNAVPNAKVYRPAMLVEDNLGPKWGGTLTLATDTPTVLTLPAGVRGIWANAFDNNVIACIATTTAQNGTYYVGVPIASGSGLPWTGFDVTKTNSIYFQPIPTGGAAKITWVGW